MVFVLNKFWVRVARPFSVAVLVATAGCGGFDLFGGGQPRSSLSSAIQAAGADSPYFESSPNNFLQAAEFVDISHEPRLIHGAISGLSDVDVYDLGPVEPGDRIVVEMTTAGALDGAVALFDASGTALLVNDHRNIYLGRSQPYVDVVIRKPGNSCFVAASATPGYSASGDYTLLAHKDIDALPSSESDRVLLVFAGGSDIRIGSRSAVSFPPFDAADIDIRYSGTTDSMIRQIVTEVRGDYAGMDIEILSTSEGARFEEDMSRLFFGEFDAALLGVAEGVDEFNATRSQEAIVFTDTFEVFLRIEPTATEIGQAIANVASHEIGHLLGLVHTTDPDGIMDVTASLNRLMEDQSFRRSPLFADVFPIGAQDAVELLLASLGGDPLLTLSKYLDARLPESNSVESDGPPARSASILSSCCLRGN